MPLKTTAFTSARYSGTAELRKHACWQTEPSRDRVKMPGPGACAGPDQQLVDVANGDNLVHERVDGRTAAVDDALSADLDYRRVRQDPEVRRRIRRCLELRVGQRSLHEERFKLHRRVRHEGHSLSFRCFNGPGSGD
jgi:hypothetical protein